MTVCDSICTRMCSMSKNIRASLSDTWQRLCSTRVTPKTIQAPANQINPGGGCQGPRCVLSVLPLAWNKSDLVEGPGQME